MRKKLLALLLAGVLTAGMSTPAFAAQDDPKNTTVKTTVAVGYNVTIPEDINVKFNEENTNFDISVSNAVLNPQGKVVVKATAAGTMKNTSGTGSTLAYTIKDDANNDFTIIEFTGDGTKTCKVNIAQAAWSAAAAGDYSGNTTFAVSYNDGKAVQ